MDLKVERAILIGALKVGSKMFKNIQKTTLR
jgi:hypothetical protein